MMIYHDFATKRSAPAVALYMPTWSLAELSALREAVFPSVDQGDIMDSEDLAVETHAHTALHCCKRVSSLRGHHRAQWLSSLVTIEASR